MKGLVLAHMGRREEGIDLVKKGVRFDLTSHICWHVFGLIQKGEKNYEEALKSYTQALRFDRENLNILRDAAQLQTQLRIFDGLVETRSTLLRLRPNVRQHWVGLAVAHHLNGNLTEARKILENYQRTLKNVPDYDIEHSETLLYYVHLLEEIGDLDEALSVLDSNAKTRAIVDRTAIMEIRARVLTRKQSEEAEHAWRSLLEHNPDCYDYYRGYLSNMGVELDQSNSEALRVLKEFSASIPKATAPRRLALTISVGDAFKELAKPYLLTGLAKGIPSLFADIKSLYKDKEKQQVIEDIVEASLTPTDPSSSTDVEPTTYLWTLYFLAQHHAYLSRAEKALSILETALSHTPTLPELHLCKARVLKRAGDYYGAARCVNDARLLDGQDRFLNTKCGKYLLRAGMPEEASTVLGLFTKKDAPSPGADLEDMQSLLYLLEEANSHRQYGKPNLALKKYMAIKKVFDEIDDDQYDFHGYNLRKFTINIYMRLLKWENTLRSHPAYVTAAVEASKIFVVVHDDPSLVTSLAPTNLTDAEKKAKKKAKKAAQKVQDDKKAPPAANEDKGLEATPQKDDDRDGLKLLASPDGLEQAAKLLHPLSTFCANNIDVWIAIYDVAVRRKKLLQALTALNHARSLDPEHPELHIRAVHLKKTASSLPQPPPAPIGPIFLETIPKIIPDDVSLETFNSQYLQRHSTCPRAILAAAKVLLNLGAPREEVEETIFTSLRDEVTLDIPSALTTLHFLKSLKSPRTEEFREACDAKFVSSTIFKTAEEQKALRQLVMKGSVDASSSLEEAVP